MALTEVYIDPSIAGDSGSGTSGSPYGDFQYALTTASFDTTNGTRLNVKAGTDEILASALDWSTNFYSGGSPTETANCVIQGYTTTAGDGGIGGISGNGSYAAISDTTRNWVTVRDIHLHNMGAGIGCRLGSQCAMINCEINNTSGNGSWFEDGGDVRGCYIHDVGNVGVVLNGVGVSVRFNEFENGTNTFVAAIKFTVNDSSTGIVAFNSIKVSGTSDGIQCEDGNAIENNSIHATGAATGQGIVNAVTGFTGSISNNVITGFSGTGGIGIDTASMVIGRLMNNSFYDCATTYNTSGTIQHESGNETTGADPFTDAANFDFTPVDTGSVIGGSYPAAGYNSTDAYNLNRGAIQSAPGAAAASGGGARVIQI